MLWQISSPPRLSRRAGTNPSAYGGVNGIVHDEAMRKFAIFLVLFTLVAAPADAGGVNGLEFWGAFRSRFPFPLQDVVVSPISEQGDAVVILSEPPPNVWREQARIVEAAFGGAVLRVDVMTKRVGFDGWAKDLVVTLKGATEPSVRYGVASLSQAMYGTDYGASFRGLDLKSWDRYAEPARQKGPPNLQINAATLQEWLFSSPQAFIEAADAGGQPSAELKLEQLLQLGKKGVFHSVDPGLVLFIIDRQQDLSSARQYLRRFLVDTDALLGAVSREGLSSLVLVGRLRTTGLSDAPPLSMDTILTLAASREENLSQSYERTSPFAGPVNDEALAEFVRSDGSLSSRTALTLPRVTSIDWAPILLSRELVNTEYGQLLNITDQMLKGWSMSNRIVYGNFPYPAPGAFPDANGVFSFLKARTGKLINQLTFNWNTAGFGVWTRLGDHEFFTLLNTNALPVSYIPDERDAFGDVEARQALRDAEDQYGKYFADLQDPYLTRVAQYAALHVIFVRYPVMARRTEPLVPEAAFRERWVPYQGEVEGAIRRLARESTDSLTLRGFSAVMGAPSSSCGKMAVISAWATEEQEAMVELASRLVASAEDELSQTVAITTDRIGSSSGLAAEEKEIVKRGITLKKRIDEYNQQVTVCSGASVTANASLRSCADLDRDRAALEDEYQREAAVVEAFEARAEAYKRLSADGAALSKLLPIIGNCEAAWKAVASGAIQSDAHSSVKTPSIVVSVSEDGQGTGGHNLDGRSVEIIGSLDTPRGTISISEDGNLLSLNPADLSRATTAGREFERSRRAFMEGGTEVRAKIVEELQGSLRAGDGKVVAFSPTALGREMGAATSMFTERGRSFVGIVSHELAPAELARATTIAGETGASLVVGTRDGVYTLTDLGPPLVSVVTRSPTDLLRAVEAKAGQAASDTANDAGGYVIASDGSLTLREMDGLRIAGGGRQTIADAGGGGSGIPPSDRSRMGAFFGDDPRSPSGRRKWFDVRPFDLATRMFLKRRDADWAKATLDHASFGIVPDQPSIVARLVIPFKATEPPVKVFLKAMFKRRQPTQADADFILGFLDDKLKTTPEGTALDSRLADIRRGFDEEMKGDAELRLRLKTDELDFFIVELDADGPVSRPG